MNTKKKKFDFSGILMVLILLLGLGILLYPSVSDYWNSMVQSHAITEYVEAMNELDPEECQRLFDSARQYNEELSKINYPLMYYDKVPGYEDLLNIGGKGIMGYISIPSISVELPIYHSTDASVLQVAVGHVQGSSLPTGGEGCHTVLSGHRGLPSARLFTDLDKLAVGDLFLLQVLNETLTYEVDQILIVLPYEVDALEKDPDQDYCTLVTCTPYGVNSHRLLVRGHRVENQEEEKIVRVTADAVQIKPAIVAPLVAAPMLLTLLIILLVTTRKKKK